MTVVDTGQAGGAQALVALAAAEVARSGGSRDDVVAVATQVAARVHLWMALPDLASLARSGRLGPPGSGPPGSRPPGDGIAVITLQDGAIRLIVPQPRAGTAQDALVDLAASVDGVTHLMVSYTNNRGEADALASRLREQWHDAEVDVLPLSAVVGGHCGPGALGVAARIRA